jgi:hypothetical protein
MAPLERAPRRRPLNYAGPNARNNSANAITRRYERALNGVELIARSNNYPGTAACGPIASHARQEIRNALQIHPSP